MNSIFFQNQSDFISIGKSAFVDTLLLKFANTNSYFLKIQNFNHDINSTEKILDTTINSTMKSDSKNVENLGIFDTNINTTKYRDYSLMSKKMWDNKQTKKQSFVQIIKKTNIKNDQILPNRKNIGTQTVISGIESNIFVKNFGGVSNSFSVRFIWTLLHNCFQSP